MRTFFFAALLLGRVAGAAAAQPGDGDLVFTVSRWNPAGGYVVYLDPSNPRNVTTLALAPKDHGYHRVRMAPDNTDLVAGQVDVGAAPGPGCLVNLRPDGRAATLARLAPLRDFGHALDHDGQWIVAGRVVNGPCDADGYLLGVRHDSGAVSTFSVSKGIYFTDVAVDRDPGARPYVLAAQKPCSGPSLAYLFLADRLGTVTTLTGLGFSGGPVELHPDSGHYLACTNYLLRVTKSGGVTTVRGFMGQAARVGRDDHVWLVSGWSPEVLRYDLTGNAVVTLFKVSIPAGAAITGIEVYGGRRLVCAGTGRPGTVVTVHLQSRKPGDGGKLYALACSLARRPPLPGRCLRFPNGEILGLDYTDPLFWTTALHLAPAVFEAFRGTTGAGGNATAKVHIPGAIPPNLGLTVFAAGVIFDTAGVRTVTNTHWFVLN